MCRKVSLIQYHNSTTIRSYVLVCTELFLFCTSFSLQSQRKQKNSINTPQKKKNIFETIAPHAKMALHLYNVLEDNIMRRLIKTNLAEDIDTPRFEAQHHSSKFLAKEKCFSLFSFHYTLSFSYYS